MRRRIQTERGRPRGKHSRFDTRILEYLVELSAKHRINTTEFFAAIIDAWKDEKATCGELTIECRLKERTQPIFLITERYNVVAQFPIPDHILKEENPLEGFDYVLEHVRHTSMIKEGKTISTSPLQIKDLKVGMKGLSLRARVIGISEPKLVPTRFHDYVVLANATLDDETSKIKLALWSGRINMVSVSDVVQIENAEVIMFKGEKQLRIGRNGRIRVVEDRPMQEIVRTP